MSILVNRPDNKRRPPDWRWQRACELAEGARPVRGRDDEVVRAACKFRRLIQRCETDMDKLAALDAHPALYEAYSLYDATDDHTNNKWELEARLLARESLPAISDKLGIDIDAIMLYERIFFDVMDRLDAPGLITHTVIGKSVQTGLAEREYDCLWKLFGYWLGPSVLDALAYKFNNPRHTEGHDGLRAAMRDLSKDAIDIKAAITMITMKSDWQTRELILTLWKDMLALEAQAGQAGIGTETYTQNVQQLVDTFQGLLVKTREDGDTRLTGQIAQLEAQGVRLRAAELVGIGVGEFPAGLGQLMSTATFPERGDHDENS